jgi:FlaA1/EpsC-like NDP-sugar epimerase
MGHATMRQFQEVRLEDLLGREPVEIDLESVRREIEERVVLVTGAAGSIGSELCRQIRACSPAQLVCVDRSETGIFYLHQELFERQTGSLPVFYVTDVGDRERMRAIFKDHRPNVVFHAAAYKHVPVMEWNVHEAIKNNVFALVNLLDIAEEHSCQSFVLISSDKAVNPTSVMGATKRLGELILSCREPNSMRCVSVRFGNVLGSSGSVIPILKQELRQNQPLTITHPEIKRFFMTAHEAISLILQAFAIGDHGDILVLDMGEPVLILELARTLIRLCGKTEDEVSIEFTGLRDGEKLCEELFFSAEEVHPTCRQKINRARGKPMHWDTLSDHLRELRASVALGGAAPIRSKLQEIVPEYCAQQTGQTTGMESSTSKAFHNIAGGR